MTLSQEQQQQQKVQENQQSLQFSKLTNFCWKSITPFNIAQKSDDDDDDDDNDDDDDDDNNNNNNNNNKAIVCNGNGEEMSGQCSCTSGFTGLACDLNEIGACTLPSPSPLSTEYIPTFSSSKSYINSGQLNLVFEGTGLEGRTVEISVGTNTTCFYPGPFFQKDFLGFPDCQDAYTMTVSVEDLSQTCHFQEVVDPLFSILEGEVAITTSEKVAVFQDVPIRRTTVSRYLLEARFPRSAELSSSQVDIVSPLDLLAAVSLQEYSFEEDRATIEITTSVAWPYQLENGTSTLVGNPSFGYSLEFATLSCDQLTEDTACHQITTLNITNIRSFACHFDGIYGFEWNFDCRLGFSPCPPPPGPNTISLNATIQSGDVCQQLTMDALLSGTLESFSTSAFDSETIFFHPNERIYLMATLSSSVTIESIELQNLKLFYGPETLQLLQDGSPTSPLNETISFVLDEGFGEVNQRTFSFVASYGDGSTFLFDSQSGSSVFSFLIEADLVVAYKTSLNKKRDVFFKDFTLTERLAFSAKTL